MADSESPEAKTTATEMTATAATLKHQLLNHHSQIKAKETKATSTVSSVVNSRKTMAIAYGLSIAFVACTVLSVFTTSGHTTPWLNNFLRISSSTTTTTWSSKYRSSSGGSKTDHQAGISQSSQSVHTPNVSLSQEFKHGSQQSPTMQFSRKKDLFQKKEFSRKVGGTNESNENESSNINVTTQAVFSQSSPKDSKKEKLGKRQSALKIGKAKKSKESGKPLSPKRRKKKWLQKMSHCNILEGKWVRDDSYPLYRPGSCPYIDEPFNCFFNGRPDKGYERFRWQPNDCNIPRLNGQHMLELLRGKRLVFVGDSLNRNMWESLLCILRNSMEDKTKVFEASGKEEFRTEDSYSFVFQDYNCSVEFFQSPFLVQEWEMPDTNGEKKETLRLDLFQRSSDKYKNADVLIFNTGHWWTHEKTSTGKGYYQEGSHIYGELGVEEAFRKAMLTWKRWVDANVDPKKTLVFFRSYSSSHFSGGRWNSGGQCDSETEPITDESYVGEYPPIIGIYESVMKKMKAPIFSLNITRITDFRKDAHPSIYRKQNLTGEERKSPLRFQDCSHWCLPGVPDTWNELVYSQLLLRHYQQQREQRQK